MSLYNYPGNIAFDDSTRTVHFGSSCSFDTAVGLRTLIEQQPSIRTIDFERFSLAESTGLSTLATVLIRAVAKGIQLRSFPRDLEQVVRSFDTDDVFASRDWKAPKPKSAPKAPAKPFDLSIDSDRMSVSFDLSTLNKRQRIAVRSFLEASQVDSAVKYLASFKGKYNYTRPERLADRSTFDKLAERENGYWLRKHESAMRYTGSSFRPDEFIPDGSGLGIEIECFIPAQGDADREGPCDCGLEDASRECSCSSEDGCDDTCNAANHGDDCGVYGSAREGRSTTQERIAETLKRHGVKRVSIKDDGSIREDDGTHSFEFTCLTSIKNMDNLKRLCAALKELGARVNASCGLHVHLDARGEASGAKIAGRLKRALPMLKRMVPKSRLENQYCQQDVSTRGRRYAKINKESLRKYKTIEVRMHSGTTDYVKISSWAKLLYTIAHSERRIPEARYTDPLRALSALTVEPELAQWVLSRIAKFAPPEAEENESAQSEASTASEVA